MSTIDEARKSRDQLAAELEAEHGRYLELFDFAPIGYLTLDRAGVIRTINLNAAHLLGAERARLIGFPLVGRVAPADRRRVLDHLYRCRTMVGTVTIEIELDSRGGRNTSVELLSKGIGGSKRDGAILTAIVDLTAREAALAERRRIDDERRRIEHAHDIARAESAAKDRFLAVLSHELRNPLSPILFTIEVLERGAPSREQLAAALALIRRNIGVEVRLIDDLLDVSRITHGKLRIERQVVALHDLVNDVVAGAATELGRTRIGVSLDLAAEDDHVNVDPARLRQVIWNLLSNAIRNTQAGGSITLRTSNRNDVIVLDVTDAGRGIAPEMLEKIFRPFDQVEDPGRARGGLGLGLAICRGLVEAHGGKIRAASDGVGHGATFTVELATVRAAEASRPPHVVPEVAARRLRILLVEDDPDAAQAISTFLGSRGHQVTIAHSVAEALAQRDAAPEILVSDIGLPDGSGVEVIAALRERHPVRGIAISGFGTENDVRRSLEAGFERHLTKPVHPEDLLEVLEPLMS